MHERHIFISLGSNLGNRLACLSQAIDMLSGAGFRITEKSRVWETEPWGVKEQPRFLNMCIAATSMLEPIDMLRTVKDIEKKLGRRTSEKWGPREIDIDILLIDDEIIDAELLKIPHPYMHERAFVLVPLTEIAPAFTHPVLKKSLQELSDELNSNDKGNMVWIIKL
jgi:2-amino-4-hydroxy-6-hydroxymethyldihydropteridine diphosphokinase